MEDRPHRPSRRRLFLSSISIALSMAIIFGLSISIGAGFGLKPSMDGVRAVVGVWVIAGLCYGWYRIWWRVLMRGNYKGATNRVPAMMMLVFDAGTSVVILGLLLGGMYWILHWCLLIIRHFGWNN